MSQIKGISSPPTSDPLIDEVRAIRQRISEQFGHDVDRLVEHLREMELRQPGRVVKPADLKRQGVAKSSGEER
jgi:hypothetical protein